MLPDDVFADVLGCLHFYDLDALLMTDSRCSALAHTAASKIRVFDFSEHRFDLYSASIAICKLDRAAPYITMLNFLSERDIADFIPSALRNCVLGGLTTFVKGSFEATREVADTIVIEGTLHLYALAFANANELVKSTDGFRSVQAQPLTVIVVKEALWLDTNAFVTLRALVDFAVSFRSVKAVHVTAKRSLKDSRIKELVNLYDRHGFALQETGPFDISVSFANRSARMTLC